MIEPKKSLGQNWLVDFKSLQKIISYANLKQEDIVLEIGPGTGNLSKLLLPKVYKVIAIELDQNLVKTLAEQNLANLELIHQDILKFNFNEIKGSYKIIGNIPYYLTSHLIRVLSEIKNKPSVVVLLVQKEVGTRISASKGNYSILSLLTQFYWDITLGADIPKEMFYPIPKVDSKIIILKPKLQLIEVDSARLFRLIKMGFSSKRKTLVNNLSTLPNFPKEQFKKYLVDHQMDLMVRAQSVGLDQWVSILAFLSTFSRKSARIV
jgi:16S rRNA (adenine1518-N6/adenine1519-N6)-dimethyltransferase